MFWILKSNKTSTEVLILANYSQTINNSNKRYQWNNNALVISYIHKHKYYCQNKQKTYVPI